MKPLLIPSGMSALLEDRAYWRERMQQLEECPCPSPHLIERLQIRDIQERNELVISALEEAIHGKER